MNKKGFTLIELLAVIVVLAIIVTLAMMTTIPMINKAKKGAATNSAHGVKKAAQLYYAQLMNDAEEISDSIVFTCKNNECAYVDADSIKHILDISGDVPEEGNIVIDSMGNIVGDGVVINGFNCIISNNTESKCLDKKDTYDVEVTLKFATGLTNNGWVYQSDVKATYGHSVSVPNVFNRYGYDPIGWDFNGDGVYNEKNDTVNSAIVRALARSDLTVYIDPINELQGGYYDVAVINGTGGGTYQTNDVVQLLADTAPSGQKFSHWLQDGEIFSYNSSVKVFAFKNIEYEAIYVDQNAVVNKKGITMIVDMFKDESANKITFVSFSTAPSDWSIDFAGIIATNDGEIGNSGDNFNDATASYVRGRDPDVSAFRYTWSKSSVNPGDTWYARAYLKYTDSNNVSHTVYGDVVTLTM